MREIKVLLIDDDAQARRAVAGYLRRAGLEIETCGDGQTALTKVGQAASAYDVVLLDWVLEPPDTGLRVLADLRRLAPDLPVIVTTGQAPEAGPEALRAGAYRYMRLPIDPAGLVAGIRELAEQDAALRNVAVAVRQILEWDMCLVWRWQRKDQRFHQAAWVGAQHELTDEDRSLTVGPSDLVSPRLLTVGEPMYFAGLGDMAVCGQIDMPRRHAAGALFSVPLRHREQIIGLLDVYKRELPHVDFTDRMPRIREMLTAFANQTAEALHNADLYRQAQSLIEINRLLARIFDLDEILDVILARGIELVNAYTGCVYLRDFETDTLVRQLAHKAKAAPPAKPIKVGAGIVGEVAKNGIAQVINDMATAEPGIVAPCDPLPSAALRSQIAVPLRREDQTIGVLVASSRNPDAFTNEDSALLQSFAQLAAQAVSQAKLMEHLRHISQPVNQRRQDLAANVVQALYDLTGKGVSLWLVDRKGNTMTIADARGVSDEYREHASIRLDETAGASYALAIGRTVNRGNLADSSEEPRFKYADQLVKEGWKSALIVPLLSPTKRPLGTLHVYNRARGEFNPTEVNFITSFANQVTNALEQQRLAEEQRLLGNVSRQLATLASLSVDEVLHSILTVALELTDTAAGVIHAVDAGGFGVIKSYVYPETQGRQTPRPGGYTRKIIETREPVIVKDAQSEPNTNQSTKAAGVQAFAGVPLLLGDEHAPDKQRVVGVLYINDLAAQRRFDAGEIPLLLALASQAAVALEKARLYTEEQISRRQAERLRRFTGAVTSARTLADVAGDILDALTDVVKYDRATLQLVEGDARQLINTRGMKGEEIDNELLRPVSEDPPIRHALHMKRPNIIADTTGRGFDVRPSTRNVRSWIAIPLVYADRALGVITVDSFQAGQYRDAPENELSIFGSQAGVAIHDARLTARLERQVKTQRVLYEVGVALLDVDDEATILQRVAAGVTQALDCGHCSIFRREAGQLVARAIEGSRKDEIPVGRTFRMGEGVAGWVAQHGESALVPDVEQDVRFAASWTKRVAPPRSLIVVPIKLNEDVYGVISAEADSVDAFDGEDEQCLATLATQVSQAIRNARFKAEQAVLNLLDQRYVDLEL